MSRGKPMYPQEERAPIGATGLIWVGAAAPFDPRRAVPLDDCLISRPRPWALVIWEPLPTKAPKPPKALPHCCYRNTVVFYHAPYIARPWSKLWRGGDGRLRADTGGFQEWGRAETRLMWDDVVAFEGEQFTIGGGHVSHSRGSWWMVHLARRAKAHNSEAA